MKPKAPYGKVIVRFHALRMSGVIITPDKFKPQPVECEIINDSKGEWDGLLAVASLMSGTYFFVDDVEYCVMERKGILMFFTEKDGKTETLRPATRGVIISDEGRVEKIGSFFVPDSRYPGHGKVLAVGPGRWDFTEGDTVHFDRSKAMVIGIDGKRALFIFEDFIYAKLEEAA